MRVTHLLVAAILAVLFGYGMISLPGMAGIWGMPPLGFVMLAGWTAIAALAIPLARPRPALLVVALAVAGIVVLRMGMALPVAFHDSSGDPRAYLVLAKNLLGGHGLVVHDPSLDADYRALFPPAYPLLLAGWGAVFGFSTEAQLALNTLTDLAAAAVIAALGAWLGRPGAGRAAGFLYMVWPSVLLSAPLAQKESLSILLVLLLALLWLRLVERGPRDRAAIAGLGIAAGLLALSQPGWAPLAALFGLVLAPRAGPRRVVASGVPAALVAVAVMLPWWVRNWITLGAFVPLTTASGASLWIGNNPQATGNWMPPPADLRGLPEMAYGPRAAARAREWMAGHPADVAALTLRKLLRAGGVAQFGLIRLRALNPPLPDRVESVLFPLSYLSHLAMLGGGAAAAARGRMPVLILLIVACALQIVLFGVWFEFGERHREFVTPFLLLLLTVTFLPARD